MFLELDVVTLVRDLPDERLVAGAVGTIVGIWAEGVYEVEFMADGVTIAVVTLEEGDLRALTE